MDQDYDEFGNYIGAALPDDEEADDFEDNADAVLEELYAGAVREAEPMDEEERGLPMPEEGLWRRIHLPISFPALEPAVGAIVLHEDKKYYPTASEVYPEAETIVQEEDTQPLETPIINPQKEKEHHLSESVVPDTMYSKQYMIDLMPSSELVRMVALAGHLHCGKTTFMDTLLQEAHTVKWPLDQKIRYTDTRKDEQERGISVKSTPVSVLLPNMRGKSHLLHMIDTPGHISFSDEVTAACRLSDGVVIVVDAVEGVMMQTATAVRLALRAGLRMCLLISKVDRLILELKLPPDGAYQKLRHTIQAFKECVAVESHGEAHPLVSPENGNVCFASSSQGWSFTLESFAQMYQDRSQARFDASKFAQRLWGDCYHDRKTGSFRQKPLHSDDRRTFVTFILEPLYKLYGQVLGESARDLAQVVEELRLPLKRSQLSMDARPLLSLVLSSFFGSHRGFTSMIVQHLPSPTKGAENKVRTAYTGPAGRETFTSMLRCDPSGPLMVNVVKQYERKDCVTFDVLARVMSGTIRVGQHVRVLGESYTQEDEEDMAEAQITGLSLGVARYRLPVGHACAGNWVLIAGVDGSIAKTATLVGSERFEDGDADDPAFVFRPLRHDTVPVVKVAVEPLNPSDLPKMTDGLRRVNKTYPLITTKVEESGEHVLLGTGELQLDCALYDLRKLFSDVEVKVADPAVAFCESVIETSSLICFAETPNHKNKLSLIAEPLEKGLSEDIEKGAIDLSRRPRGGKTYLESAYGWDKLAARRVWAFGPDPLGGPNILLDDTLPSEVDKMKLASVRESVVQGFQWGTREGPLCDEPIRGVKFKVLDATLADEPIHRSGNQIIPTARRVAYSAFLLATPRLMEPVFFVEIQTPLDCMNAVYTVLSRRRGHVTKESPKPGSPLYTVEAYLPVMDSFGFETDLRSHTQGQAFCVQVFDHWSIVPGDPLDKSVMLRPLEPASANALARDFMMKTRRRKGLSEDVTISKFFDADMLAAVARQEM